MFLKKKKHTKILNNTLNYNLKTRNKAFHFLQLILIELIHKRDEWQ